MRLLARIACAFGWHVPMPGIEPAWSVYWRCGRCGSTQLGGVGRSVRRWYQPPKRDP